VGRMEKNYYGRGNHLSNYKNKKMACLFGPVTQSLWVLVFYSLSCERRSSSISLSIFVALLILCVPSKAYAYIDPGTGSMILQGLIAGLMGVLFTIKIYWTRIKSFFFRPKIDEKKKPDRDEQ